MRIETLSLIAVTLLLAGCGKQSNTSDETQPTNAADKPATVSQGENEPANSVAATEQEAEHEAEDHDHGPGMGHGMGGPGRGMGRGGGFRPDMMIIHAMFAAKEKIKRTVKPLPTGAEAITESDDEEIASLIQEHVPAMENRVLEDSPLPPMTFHPIFKALIKHSDDYSLEYEDTDKGIKVTYVAEDPFVIMLVQEHSKLVSRFLKNGMSEIHKPYELPKLKDADKPATKE